MTVVPIQQESVGFFDDPNQASRGILPLQVSVSDPSVPTLLKATGLISPDTSTKSRLAHFDSTLYDLRDHSHLVRFLKVLLGDAGTGQLRKRYTVARLQTTLESTHFYDLDAFYGAIFGAQRKVSEQLPINPMSATATQDEWDTITTSDSQYRARLLALAKSLPMAGTVPGLQQAAEALTGVECDVYETWQMLDSGNEVYSGRDWDEVESTFADWDSFGTTAETWDSVLGAIQIGRSGLSNRDEVYIRPKKDYTPSDGTVEASREAERQRQEDEMNVSRVLNRLKPAGILLTVDNRGIPLHRPTQIAGLQADSNFWEIITKARARPGLSSAVNVYPLSPVKVSLGIVDNGTLTPLPKPPFSASQGHQWSYNSLIVSTKAIAVKEAGKTVTGGGTVVDRADWEKVPVSRSATRAVQYVPAWGITDQRALLAAQAAADSVLVAHPYSGPRVVVPTHG